jgi:hypothetical protein
MNHIHNASYQAYLSSWLFKLRVTGSQIVSHITCHNHLAIICKAHETTSHTTGISDTVSNHKVAKGKADVNAHCTAHSNLLANAVDLFGKY